MIHINLLPTNEVEEASSRRKEVLLAGGLLTITLAAVLSVYFFQGTRLNAVAAKLSRTENEMVAIRKQNQDLEKMEQQKKEIEGKIRVVRLLTSPARRAASVHILDDLSDSAPQMLWLTDFTEVKGAAKINGRSVDNQTIAAFARKLSNSRYFKKVEIRETVQEKPIANLRKPPAGGKGSALDNLPIPVTRFLVETSIDYLPGVEKEEPQEDAKAKGEKVQKEAENKGNKNAPEKGK
jgi:Tfp pilus assembly protein PilN